MKDESKIDSLDFDLEDSDSEILEGSKNEEENTDIATGIGSARKPNAKRKNPYFFKDEITQIYLDEMGKFPVLAKENFMELLSLYQQNGDEEALHKLVVHNLRLSTITAKKYSSQIGFTYLDIIQICNKAMCGDKNAFTSYSPGKGPLVDYILYSMRNAVNRELIETGSNIRVPEWVIIIIARARRKMRELRYDLGREATVTELAVAMGMTEKKLSECFQLHGLNICSIEEQVRTGNSIHSHKTTIGTRLVAPVEKPDLQVRAKEGLENSFRMIQDLLITIADTIPKVFAKGGRKQKDGHVERRDYYKGVYQTKVKTSNRTKLLIERNFNIVVEKFGLEDETLEPKPSQRVADIISKRYGAVVSRQVIDNALKSIWKALPPEYHYKNMKWLCNELESLETLMEITCADRPHLISLLKKGNRLF